MSSGRRNDRAIQCEYGLSLVCAKTKAVGGNQRKTLPLKRKNWERGYRERNSWSASQPSQCVFYRMVWKLNAQQMVTALLLKRKDERECYIVVDGGVATSPRMGCDKARADYKSHVKTRPTLVRMQWHWSPHTLAGILERMLTSSQVYLWNVHPLLHGTPSVNAVISFQ